MSNTLVLGLDIGTSGSRAVAIDDGGRIVASATSAHAPFVSPGPAWAEQDPADWWRAAREALGEVLAHKDVAAAEVSSIGLSGQMHGAVLLDSRRVTFCGRRSSGATSAPPEECRWLNMEIGETRLLELTSNPALTNFTLTKLLWVRRHEPDIWARVRHVLLPKDYVRYQLSGALRNRRRGRVRHAAPGCRATRLVVGDARRRRDVG